jgi:hypothetical protein
MTGPHDLRPDESELFFKPCPVCMGKKVFTEETPKGARLVYRCGECNGKGKVAL